MSNNGGGDDILEALKGLTIKFEVKITGVTRDTDGFSEENRQPSSNHAISTKPANIKPAKTALETDDNRKPFDSFQKCESNIESRPVKSNQPSDYSTTKDLDQVPKAFESHRSFERENTINDIAEPELRPRVSDVDSNASFGTRQTYEANPNAPALVPSVLTRRHGLLEKPKKPKIVRGELKSQQETCCTHTVRQDYPAVAYVAYSNSKLVEITKAINDIAGMIQDQPEVRSVEVGDIVFAKSKDDEAWYRSVIESVNDGNTVQVNYFDWGLYEELEYSRIRRINQADFGLSANPACAVKVKFTNQPGDQLLDAALQEFVEFVIRVNSYDAQDDSQSVTVIGLVPPKN